MLRFVSALVVSVIALSSAVAEPRLREFREWMIGCDNRNDCRAIGFGPESGSGQGALGVVRSADPEARPELFVAFNRYDDGDLPDGTVIEVATESGPIASASIGTALVPRDDDRRNFEVRDERLQQTLLEALRRATTLRFTVAGTDRFFEVSLDGASAALLAMDDRQRRVGTVTALVRRGDRPATAIPAPARIAPQPASARDPRWRPVPARLPNPVVQRVTQRDDTCDVEVDDRSAPRALGRVAADIVLVEAFCLRGAYNVSYRYYLWNDRSGRLTPVAFPVPEGVENADGGILTNPDFDAETLSISQFAKGRGLGDCGTASEWRWDGRAFQTVRYVTMPRCQGLMADDWFTLHRSE